MKSKNFKIIGDGWKGISQKSGKPYIQLAFKPKLISKMRPEDMVKIYIFKNTKPTILTQSDYLVFAPITGTTKTKRLSKKKITNEMYLNAMGLPLPWEKKGTV